MSTLSSTTKKVFVKISILFDESNLHDIALSNIVYNSIWDQPIHNSKQDPGIQKV